MLCLPSITGHYSSIKCEAQTKNGGKEVKKGHLFGNRRQSDGGKGEPGFSARARTERRICFNICGGCWATKLEDLQDEERSKTSLGELREKKLGEIEVKEAKKCGNRARGDLGFPY